MANTGRPNLTTEPAWRSLQEYYDEHGSKLNMIQMFKDDSARFDKFR